MSWVLVYLLFGWLIRVGMVPVVLRRDFAPGAAMAWLGIVFLHPYIGATLYGFVGEARLGTARVARHRQMVNHFRSRAWTVGALPESGVDRLYLPLEQQARKIGSMPPLGGNAVEFILECPTLVDKLVADIAAAGSTVDLLYYIFACDESARRVVRALTDAAGRGVRCRVLVDAVASRGFFHSAGLARPLRAAGIEVREALPVALLRRGLPRMDLRNHRKLAIIDGKIAFAGSHNLINADYNGRRGGPWVDLTGRFTGPIVGEFAVVFAEDWSFESGQLCEVPSPSAGEPPAGNITMQIVPTGPTAPGETYRRLLLGAIHCAQSQLILTTPYFVPDEPTLVALQMAADRGVNVSLIVPQRPDHMFTAAAGRAHFARLMESGIAIFLYQRGLIHAKTATVDDKLVLFGSANLDVRSFNLNFELSSLLYDREVTQRLRAIQNGYLADSHRLDPKEWASRSPIKTYADRTISLLSPLL
jgi:cardiolipin synthase